MLLIRQPQLVALGQHVRAGFEEKLCACFVQAYPRECRQAGGPAAMLRWVRAGVGAAVAAGYTSQHACGRWLLLMMMLGIDFASDPQLPWMAKWLDPASKLAPDDRIDDAFDEALSCLGATAGEDAEFVVRAMLRIRDLDFASLPLLEGQAAVADACERLHRLYPEKRAFLGGDSTAAVVESYLGRAHALGLVSAAGGFLFVLLSFMLGSGFDHDPLHPWAAEILSPAVALSSGERAARLELAARAHLSISLSSA
jgi:hypothetical protein